MGRFLPEALLGKTISGAMLRDPESADYQIGQVFLFFDDGTALEIWAQHSIRVGSGLDRLSIDGVEAVAPPGSRVVSMISTAPEGGQLRARPPMAALSALLSAEDRVAYILEQFTQDYTRLARDAIADLEAWLEAGALADAIAAAIRNACAESREALLSQQRPTILAARPMVSLRHRLANEIALCLGQDLPYPGPATPPFAVD